MYQQGYLTAAQYHADMAEKLALATSTHIPKNATVVYPEVSTPTKYPDFVNYVVSWLQQHFTAAQLSEGGLRVQTTLDPSIQEDAYAAAGATLNGSSFPTDMAIAVVQPQTGFVPALFGGRGFGGDVDGEQVNLALGGCPPVYSFDVTVAASCWSQPMISGGGSGRQPGSSWKPFTLATAFEQGIPPSTVYQSPYVYQIPGCKVPNGQPASYCQIHNDEGDLGGAGEETLAQATAQSTNTVYAQVAPQVGCTKVAQTAKSMGIESAYFSTSKFPYCETYALGELGVSPLDMASAYGVFADRGQHAQPTPILEIVNDSGKVLVDNISHLPKTTTVLSATVADNVTSVLQSVITSGTGTAASLGRPAAGKTGTTTNTTDAWFVGYTPTLSAAVWMGNEQSDTTSLGSVTGHLLDGEELTYSQVYGGTWPALTWQELIERGAGQHAGDSLRRPRPDRHPCGGRGASAGPDDHDLHDRADRTWPTGRRRHCPRGGTLRVSPSSLVAPEPIAAAPSTTTTTEPPSTTSTSTTPRSTVPTPTTTSGSGGPSG